MTHDVEELRAGLRAQAEKPDFTVSLDDVRRRAGRQRTRRAVVVSVVAVVAALALAVPLGLLKFGDGTPTADLSKDQLPRPEQGWRIVDDPISTAARDLSDNFETVLWFTRHGDGTIRLNEGIYDPASDRVRYRHPDQVGDGVGELELPSYAQTGNRPGGYRMPGTGPGIGLYYGEDVARIEFVSQPGLYDQGERTVLEAKLARLSTDRNVIAFWVPPLDRTALAPEDRHDDFTVRAYDADGDVVKPDPRAVDPDSRLDPVTAPQLGDLIRTGVDAGSGDEMVVAFRGKNGWAGLVLGRRDRETGKVTDLAAATTPMELPLDEMRLVHRPTGTPLAGDRVLVVGLAMGCRDYVLHILGREAGAPTSTATWSEDRRVTVWWLDTTAGDLGEGGALPQAGCA